MVQTEVLVIGAGPTGMVAALCLAAAGVECLLLDRQERLGRHPKAHELSARSIEILTALGVPWEELAAEASPHADSTRILFCGTLAEELGCIDLAADGGDDRYRAHLAAPVPYLNLSQVELERVLRRRVEADPRIELRTNQQWEAFSAIEGPVDSEVLDRSCGARYTVRSRAVIAADGAGSRSRKALGIGMVGPDKIHDFVNAAFEADLSDHVASRGKLYFLFHPDAAGGLIAHHIERRWVYNCVVHTPHERVEDYTEEVMERRIRAALGGADVPLRITSMSHWRMTAQVAERFVEGAIFLAGDAAHRFPPTGGLGMNSGIGDAHNLAWKLAWVLRGRAPASLLDTYEQERRPIIETNCEQSRRNAGKLFDVLEAFGLRMQDIDSLHRRLHTGAGALLPEAVRDWLLRQAHGHATRRLARYHTDPAVRQRVLDVIASQRSHFDRIGLDLGYRYEEGALVGDGTPPDRPADEVSEYRPSTRPGARFPHFWLDAGARKRSSHELVDLARATLVLGADLDPTALGPVPPQLRAVSLSALGVPLSGLADLHAACQIAPTGALLLRPDGHVAWRQQAGVCPSVSMPDAILRQTRLGLSAPSPEAPTGPVRESVPA